MLRRRFLFAAATAGALTLPQRYLVAQTATLQTLREQWRELLPQGVDLPGPDDPLAKTKAEWRAELDPAVYRILFEEATEPAFSSPLDSEKRPGVYLCAACELPLFTSAMKFDSGTGWPSFFTTIPGRLDTKTDFKLIWPRTEYHCVRCGGHQGHVFEDGPRPTGERWCNNGLALNFLPSATPRS